MSQAQLPRNAAAAAAAAAVAPGYAAQTYAQRDAAAVAATPLGGTVERIIENALNILDPDGAEFQEIADAAEAILQREFVAHEAGDTGAALRADLNTLGVFQGALNRRLPSAAAALDEIGLPVPAGELEQVQNIASLMGNLVGAWMRGRNGGPGGAAAAKSEFLIGGLKLAAAIGSLLPGVGGGGAGAGAGGAGGASSGNAGGASSANAARGPAPGTLILLGIVVAAFTAIVGFLVLMNPAAVFAAAGALKNVGKVVEKTLKVIREVSNAKAIVKRVVVASRTTLAAHKEGLGAGHTLMEGLKAFAPLLIDLVREFVTTMAEGVVGPFAGPVADYIETIIRQKCGHPAPGGGTYEAAYDAIKTRFAGVAAGMGGWMSYFGFGSGGYRRKTRASRRGRRGGRSYATKKQRLYGRFRNQRKY
jgi:hypothetical protein